MWCGRFSRELCSNRSSRTATDLRPWMRRTYNEPGGAAMTSLLQQAFAEAAKLSPEEQDLLASRLLAEIAAEDEFDRDIAGSAHKLASLAREALAERRAGETEELDPERL